MKKYEIFSGNNSSNITTPTPMHTVQAASVDVVLNGNVGFYVFYDDSTSKNVLHAIAIAPGVFVRTVVEK